MSATRTTRGLAVLLLVLLLLDALVWRQQALDQAPLPQLNGFEVDGVDSLLLTLGEERIRLQRTADQWQVLTPRTHPADPVAVAAVLDALRGGVRPEARVDQGNHERYGLEGLETIRVSVDTPDTALMTLHIGRDAPGGATFVRFDGEDAVYRARIGGRALYDKPAASWRDARLWRLPSHRLVGLAVERADGQRLRWHRSAAPAGSLPSMRTTASRAVPREPAVRRAARASKP